MKLRTLAIALSVVILGLIFSQRANAQEEASVRKKLIEAGWDMPNTSTLRKNIKQMEETPFDGVILTADGKDGVGKSVSTLTAFSTVPWKKEWFQGAVNDLKAVHSTQLTDNFLLVMNLPGNVDIFDDAGWKEIANHWSIVAWIAREGHLKGICFDQEEYQHAQFGYTSQAQRDKHSFAEYQIKARQRGREIINAVASVDPNLVIFTYSMESINVAAINSSNPQRSLQESSFGLYPAFINGWLDAAPPTMIFVDGAEDQGYRANSRLDFVTAANMMRNTALNLVAPEDRRKYLAQVQASFGIYLDAYINPSTSPWYIDPKGLTPTQRLQANVGGAVNAANEYVWVYGEKYRWWDTQNSSVKPESWESVLPGIHNALLSITHPYQLAEQQIAASEKSGSLVNLLKNGDFSAAPTVQDGDKVPASWARWRIRPHVTFAQDDSINHGGAQGGSGRLTEASNGCFAQPVAVKAGETYIVQGWIRNIGQGVPFIRVQIKNMDDLYLYTEKPAKDGWQKVQIVVTAPEGAGSMWILLTAKDHTSAQDVTWFDDISVYKIR
jgi:hypothetical protein